MNQTKIGTFIAKCRKEKKLTQAQLAEKLNITDRAVSKWETGKSMPDASIMLELCEILGITVNELLSGEQISRENYEKKADENLITLKRKTENNMTKNVIISAVFSVTLLVGVMVCLICDFAISGHFTWSLIPFASIALAWVTLFPSLILGKKGIAVSLLSLSIFIIPYLYLLSSLIKVRTVFTIGTVTAVISILFLWYIYVIFNRIGKSKKSVAFGIAFLSAIPFELIINAVLSKILSEPIIDLWDMLSVLCLLICAAVSFAYGYAAKKHLDKHTDSMLL